MSLEFDNLSIAQRSCTKRPDFVFASEILYKQITVEKFHHVIGFEGSMVVKTQGMVGGLLCYGDTKKR